MGLNVTIDSLQLKQAVTRLQGGLVERSIAHIAIKADSNLVRMSATDQSIAAYSSAEALVAESGLAFVSGKLFSEVVSELPQGPVQLTLKDQYLELKAGQASSFLMKFPLLEQLSWREPPTVNFENSMHIPATKLSYMIDQIQMCVATDSTRNYGTVAYMHRPLGDKELLRLVGTDSYRLSYSEFRFAMPDQFLTQGICLSKRGLQELGRICGEGFETIKLSVSSDGTTLAAEIPNHLLFIRLSAVKYPNYAAVIPETKTPGVMFERSELQHVTRRVMIASDKGKVLQLSFSPSSLTLRSKNTTNSEGIENVRLDSYQGPKCDIIINGKFLSEVFSVTSADKMTMNFKDSGDPVTLAPYGEPADCRTRHVLMPILGSADH